MNKRVSEIEERLNAIDCERIDDASDDLMNDMMIELRRLAEIEQAAIKLVKCKGRYHTEQNMVALAKLVGVTLPPVTGKDD